MKKQIVQELEIKILTNQDLAEIGQWAYRIYEQKIQNANESFYDILLRIAVMEYGAKYYLSVDELDLILDLLYDDLYRYDQDTSYTMIRFCRELQQRIRNNVSMSDIGFWAELVLSRFSIQDPILYKNLVILGKKGEFFYKASDDQQQRLYQELTKTVDALLKGEKALFSDPFDQVKR